MMGSDGRPIFLKFSPLNKINEKGILMLGSDGRTIAIKCTGMTKINEKGILAMGSDGRPIALMPATEEEWIPVCYLCAFEDCSGS
jgi:hypothetical protein